MRLKPLVLALLCLIAPATVQAHAGATPATQPSRNAVHGPHVCQSQHIVLRAAWHGDKAVSRGASPVAASAARCMGGAARIGAGYTRLLSTTALQHPHHRLRT